MRLATRTGLAAFAATAIAVVLVGAVFTRALPRVLQDRVDAQLDDRAATAPVLVAVAERLAVSELNGTVDGARVAQHGEVVDIGRLPDDPLPTLTEQEPEGFSTVTADGQRWRLLSIEVADVPRPGDRAVVQLVAPLGDVDERAAELRRRAMLIGLATMLVAGAIGYAFGRRATRPLSRLRRDADRWDDADPATWSVAAGYGSPEVDDVAAALNTSLSRLGEESARRQSALDAARAFAASATHELRTPLQSAMTNVDIARSPLVDDDGRADAIEHAHRELRRLTSGLTAVRALADAEFAEPSWFAPADVGALVQQVVDDVRGFGHEVALDLGPDPCVVPLWADGVRLAIENLLRNARIHGGDAVSVSVAGATVTVDDDGPGIPVAERERLLRRFERGTGSGGSGLGLAIAHQVAVAHGGSLTIADAPTGGARLVLRLARPGSPS